MHVSNSRMKWAVEAEQMIAAPAHEVWHVISKPGNLELCHPFCAQNPVQAWPGDDSRDEVHYLSGRVYERRFGQWLEGTGYDLEIFSNNDALASVSWRITPVDEQRCTLRITVYTFAFQKLPAVVRWFVYAVRVRPMLGSYLDSVVKGVEWYVTRGEPVAWNQFGRHPWFSASGPITD